MGVNILAGDHHTQMLVYDFDRNGRAELILRTAPGTRDGQGNYVNQAADDDEIRFADNTIDWRSATMATITGGHEYLTVFEGTTGKALHTIFYYPNRDTCYGGEASGLEFNWDDRPNKRDYAATYGNRSNRFLACVAHLDGAGRPASAIVTRGYYTQAFLWALDFDGTKLKERWRHASVSKTEVVHTDADFSYPEEPVVDQTASYQVMEMAGGRVVRTTEGSGDRNVEVSVPYRRYNVVDGKLYVRMPSGGPKGLEYNHYFMLTVDGQQRLDFHGRRPRDSQIPLRRHQYSGVHV